MGQGTAHLGQGPIRPGPQWARPNQAKAQAALTEARTRDEAARIEAEQLDEQRELMRKLWALVAEHAPSDGSNGSTAHAEVARVWPIVVDTFERLGAGVEALRARLSVETAAREAAEKEASLLRVRYQ